MMLATLLALLPVFAIGMGYAVLMEDEILPPPDSLPLTFATISAAASVFFGAVFAAAVSRLYRSFTGIDAPRIDASGCPASGTSPPRLAVSVRFFFGMYRSPLAGIRDLN